MNKILACIDGSRSTESVCDHAAWVGLRTGNPLVFLHAIRHPHAEPKGDLSGSIGLGGREALLAQMVEEEEKRAKLLREQGRALLEDAVARVQDQGIEDAGGLLRNDRVVAAIGDMQDQAALIIVGKQGHDGEMVERHIGSHLESLIRTVERPVLVAPPTFTVPERFMIAYDGSPTAQITLDAVAAHPLLKGLEAHVLLVGADSTENKAALETAADRLESAGHPVETARREGDVTDAVCDYRQAHDIQLLAMGAYGHSRLRRWFIGSTTTDMIMRSPIPLLIVR